MDGVKPWQLAVIIIGLVGGLGLVVWNLLGGQSLHTPDSIMLMDVITGDRFIANVSGDRSVFLPEKNPDTGEYTLLPIAQGDDGAWYVRRLNEVASIPQDELKAISNFESAIASPSKADPKPLRN